jgi:hypothetical protein
MFLLNFSLLREPSKESPRKRDSLDYYRNYLDLHIESLRVIPRENRADSCNVGYIDVPDFARSNFFG